MSSFARSRCIAIAISLALAVPVASAQEAPEASYPFNLPAQSLADSLRALGQLAGINIVFDPESVRGLQASPLTGSYASGEALQRLLRGSGLVMQATQGGSYWVGRAENQDADASRAVKMNRAGPSSSPAVTTPAFGGVVQMADMVVIGQRENTYTTSSSSGATRTETDLRDTPQSVSIITRKLIADQQAQTLADALLNASGVQVTQKLEGQGYKLRGFNEATVLTDGLRSGPFSFSPIWGADSVEVLKGPEAILAGKGGYGGVINLTLKKPQVTPLAVVTSGVGSYGQIQTGVDLGGALTAGKRLSYRLVAQVDRKQETGNGYNGGSSFYVAPSLRWASGGTEVLVGLERSLRFIPTPDFAVVPAGKRLGDDDLPVGVFGSKEDGIDFTKTRGYYAFQQGLFGSDWTFRSRGEYSETRFTAKMWRINDGLPVTAAGDGMLVGTQVTGPTRVVSIQNDVTGTFTTGPFTHRVVLGSDYVGTQGAGGMAFKGMVPFNVFTSPPVQSFDDLPAWFSFSTPYAGSSELGYFLQDQIGYGERWIAQLAMRRAYARNRGPDTAKWLPNVGLVYRLTPAVSFYANGMRGYAPRTGQRAENGALLPGTTSQQYEIGSKSEFMDKRLSLTTAVYRIKVDNSAFNIPGTPFFRSGPGRTSQGIEVELRGRVRDGLDVSTTLTHIKVKTADGSPAIEQPRNSASLWLTYQFQSAPLDHWGVGLGVFARSDVVNERNNRVNGKAVYMGNPGNARVDAHLGYTGRNWSLNLGIKNLMDRRLYAASANDHMALFDSLERTWMLTAKANF